MLAIQLSRQIWQSVNYIQSDSSAFVWKLTTWLHKLMSFPALQHFLTFRTWHWNTYVVEILVRLKGKRVISLISLTSEMPEFHPRMRMVVLCHLRCSQEMKMIPQTSEKMKQPPLCLAGSPLHVPSRHLQTTAPCLKGEQRNEFWSSAMTHIRQCIFLALLSGTALLCSTKNILNYVGNILHGKAKHAVRDSKGSSYYFVPYSNYSLYHFVLMLIINLALHNACNPSISEHFLSIL